MQAKHVQTLDEAKATFQRCLDRFPSNSASLAHSLARLNAALSRLGFGISDVLNDCDGQRYYVFCNKVSAHLCVRASGFIARLWSHRLSGCRRRLQERLTEEMDALLKEQGYGLTVL